MDGLEYFGMLAAFTAVLVSAIGGGGGGAGMIIPVAIGFWRVDYKNAIRLSNANIFLGAFLRYVINMNKPHPLKNGKGILVDFNYVVIMLPMIIAGSAVGIILNIMTPQLVIAAIFFTVMGILVQNMAMKSIDLWQRETQALLAEEIKADESCSNNMIQTTDSTTSEVSPELQAII